jgi:hypothetical protein
VSSCRDYRRIVDQLLRRGNADCGIGRVIENNTFDLMRVSACIGLFDSEQEAVTGAETLLGVAAGKWADKSEFNLVSLCLGSAEADGKHSSCEN